jgi:FG-GAP repeat.
MSFLRVMGYVLFLSSLCVAQVGFKTSGYNTANLDGSVAVGDFDRDGYPDIAAIDRANGQLSIYRNSKNGTFTGTGQYDITTLGNPSWVDTADFDGDGKLDLIFWTAFSQQMELWHGNGDGTFSF